MTKYHLFLGLFVFPGEELIRDFICEARDEAEARAMASEAVRKGEEGGIYFGPLATAQKFEEIPPQLLNHSAVQGVDTSVHPKFAINSIERQA
jgi:predicted dinucleotide-binding enzyme